MKILLLIIQLMFMSKLLLAQNSKRDNILGKWNFVKLKMDMGLYFDINNIDSSYSNFIAVSNTRQPDRIWNEIDSSSASRNFQEMRTFYTNSYLQFRSNSTFVTNFFSDQEDSISGTFKFDNSTSQLFLRIGKRILNQSLTKVTELTPTTLTFVCTTKYCEVITATFKKE